MLEPNGKDELARMVEEVVQTTTVSDIHTHLYDPAFGGLLLWGIDELLVYHYLVAEGFRYLDIPYDAFWGLPQLQQAELVWEALFIRNSPISEACRGVVTTLNALGLDVQRRDLNALRRWFQQRDLDQHVGECLKLAGVSSVCMTNSPFDPQERLVWERGCPRDDRFSAALRIDPLLLSWNETAGVLAGWGYDVRTELSGRTFSEVRRFLADWTRLIKPRFLMVSLPPGFEFPTGDACGELLANAVLPHTAESGLPLALMPGVKRGLNPSLRMAGDGVGRTDLAWLGALCAGYPSNLFAVTALARENQHELCVLARKFRNLHIFGCWWFTNVPSLVEEMTRMRIEMLGLSVTLQHSDARVLEQVIYKWRHTKEVVAKVLVEKYADLAAAGWHVQRPELERDVRQLFGGAFDAFCGRR